MANKEKEVPKAIKEFYDRHDKVMKLLANTKKVHSDAYSVAADQLKKDGDVEFDPKLLDDVKFQDKFLDKMMDHYINFAMEKLNIKDKPKNEFEEDVILQKYIGVTKAEMRNILRENKSGYTQEAHEKKRDELIKKQQKELIPLRHGHMDESNIEDILNHTKSGKYFVKDNIETVDSVVDLLDLYRLNGDISLSELEKTSIPDLYLTDEAKKEKKDSKDKYKKA